MNKDSITIRLLAVLAIAGLYGLINPLPASVGLARQAQASPQTTWGSRIVDNQGGSYASLALDRDGRPHITYAVAEAGDIHATLMHAWTAQGSWLKEAIDLDSQPIATSIDVDPDGRIHISYHDLMNRDLKYLLFDTGFSTIWEAPFVVDANGDVGLSSSIAATSNGLPRIAYWDATNLRIKLASKSAGGSWSKNVVVELDCPAGVSPSISLVLDSNNTPHLTYYDCANNALVYGVLANTGWKFRTLDTGRLVGQSNSLALDSHDRPHVSYRGLRGLSYTYLNGSTWSKPSVVDGGFFAGFSSSLGLDSVNRPHIGYADLLDTGEEVVKYAHFDGVRWVSEILATAPEGNPFQYVSLGLDQADVSKLAYLATDKSDLTFRSAEVVVGGVYLPFMRGAPVAGR